MNFLTQFVSFLESQKEKPSKATVKNYKADIGIFMRWYEESTKQGFAPSDITPETITLYKQAKTDSRFTIQDSRIEKEKIVNPESLIMNQTISPRSIERHLSSLRKFFQFLAMEGALNTNPFEQMKTASAEAKAHEDPWKLKDFKNHLYVYNAADLTIKNYVMDVAQFMKWAQNVLPGNNPQDKNIFRKINKDLVETYKNRLLHETGISPNSINRKLSSIRRYMQWASEAGLLQAASQDNNIQNVAEKKEAVGAGKFSLAAATAAGQLSNQKNELPTTPEYSNIPPVRLFQKIMAMATLSLDTFVTAPIAATIEKGSHLAWKIQGGSIFQEIKDRRSLWDQKSKIKDRIGNWKLEIGNYPKGMYAPLAISTANFPFHKKALHHMRHTRPEWYKKYHSYPVAHYFHLSILVIFMSALGFAFYSAFVETPQSQKPIFAAATSPLRVLSFQGRLTDASDNPITAAKQVRFIIYNDISASGAARLWEEVRTIEPDTDGVFSVLMGHDSSTNGNAALCNSGNPPASPATGACGIPQSLFADNDELFLGVTIMSDAELTPRQQLATVAYATNAEVLQGLPPITDASVTGNTNTILALNSSGTLSIPGSSTTTFQATGAQFKVTGQTTRIETNSGSAGNIQLVPDGFGIIDLQKPLLNTSNSNNITTATGAVEVDDLFAILATSSGQSAFTINQTGSAPLISASASGIAKFTVDNSGNVTAAGNLILSNSSATTTFGSIAYTWPTSGQSAGYTLSTNGSGTLSWADPAGAIGNFWRQNSGALYPANSTVDFLFGGVATSSATFHLYGLNQGTNPVASIAANTANAGLIADNRGNGDIFTASSGAISRFVIKQSGSVGIGTTTPDYLLDIEQNSASDLTLARFYNSNNDNAERSARIALRTGSYEHTYLAQNGGAGAQTLGGAVDTILMNTWTSNDNGDLHFGTNNELRMTVHHFGNVGIGTTAPVGILHVNGIAGGNAAVIVNQAGIVGDIFTASSSGTPRFVINNAGNVGIGTALPAAFKLEIAGNIGPEASGTRDLGSAARVWNNLYVNNIIGGGSGIQGFWSQQSGTLYPANSTVDFLFGGVATSSATFHLYGLNQGTNPVASVAANTSYAGLVVDNRGNGDIFAASSSGLNRFVIKNNGSVGIGTNLPSANLHVVGTSAQMKIEDTSGTSTSLALRTSGTDFSITTIPGFTTFAGGTGDAVNLVFNASDKTNQLYLSTTGNNVGIGTSAPTGVLHVNGIAGANAAAIINQAGTVGPVFTASAAGTTRFTIANDGSIVQTATTVAGNANVINANSITSGVAASISATALTSGTALGITASNPSSNLTGNLINVASANHTYMTLNNRDLTIGGHTNYNTTLTGITKVMVYDTSEDLDGGRWTDDERAKSSSWYNEAASATRSSIKPFPKKAILISSTDNMYIYDAKDNSLWMQFNKGTTTTEQMIGPVTNSDVTYIFGLNGKIYVATNGTAGGLYTIDFKADTSYRYNSSDDWIGNKTIANRNTTVAWTPGPGGPIINNVVTGVHAAVVKGKTYVAALGSGTSPIAGINIINETDNTVVTLNEGSSQAYTIPFILPNGNFYAFRGARIRVWYDITSITDGASVNTNDATYIYSTTSFPALGTSGFSAQDITVTQGTSTIDSKSNTLYFATNGELNVLQEKQGDETNGSIKYYTKDYITEEMVGTIAGMWPIATASASTYDAGQTIPVSGRIADATTRAKALVVKGATATFASGVRGTGITLGGTSFLCSDYSTNCATYDTTYDGTTALSVSTWINLSTLPANTATYAAIAKDNLGNARSYALTVTNQGGNTVAAFFATVGGVPAVASDSANLTTGTWYHLTGTFDGTSLKLYVNGVNKATTTASGSLTAATTPLTIGAFSDASNNGKLNGTIDEPTITLETLTLGQVKQQYLVGYRALQNHTANTVGGIAIGADNHQALYGTSNSVKGVDVSLEKGFIYAGTALGGVSALGIDSDTLLDIYNSAGGIVDDTGTAWGSGNNTQVSLSVSKGYGTGMVMAFASANALWLQSNNTDFKDFLAQSYNPFGTNLTQSNVNVDTMFRIFNQLSSRIDNYALGTATTSAEPFFADAFRVDNNGNFLSRSLMNSATAMQFQDAVGNTLLNIDTTNSRIGVGTTAPTAAFHVSGIAAGNAAAIVNQAGSVGDIFTASSSGTNRFVITNAGNVGIGTTLPAAFKLEIAGNIGPEASGTRDLGSASRVWNNLYVNNIIGGGSGIQGFWSQQNGALYPANTTVDFFIGATATTSAKFAVLNVNSGTPTASVSAGTAGGVYLTADGKLATTAKQKLTIGDSTTTGDLLFSPGGHAIFSPGGNVGIGTTAPTTGKLVVTQSSTETSGSVIGTHITTTNTPASTSTANVYGSYTLGTAAGSVASGGVWGGYFQATSNIDAPGTIGNIKGVHAIAYNGGSADITQAIGVNGQAWHSGSGILAQAIGLLASNATDDDSGSITDAAGLVVDNQTAATNNSNVVLGTTSIPTGNFSIYSSSTYQSYFAGNVGIGTTSPLAALDVRGSNATTPGASISAVSNFAAMVVDNRGNGDLFTASSGAISRFVIKQNGSVGIGTNLPVAPLHVETSGTGTTFASNIVLALRSQASGRATGLQFSDGTNTAFNVNYLNGATAPRLGLGGATEVLSILTGGNVGIGTTSPLAALDVRGSNATTPGASISAVSNFAALVADNRGNGDLFAASSGAISRFVIKQNGSVGIGTNLPVAPLHVETSGTGTTFASNIVLALRSQASGRATGLQFSDGTNTAFNVNYLNGATAPRLGLGGATEVLSILTGGNVGIGTTAPTGLLHVSGIAAGNAAAIINQAGSVGDIFTASSSGETKFVITNDGNVGVGTSLPGTNLHVYAGASGASPYVTSKFVVENSDHAGIGILTPTDKAGSLYFGTVGNAAIGGIEYYHSTSTPADQLRLLTAGSARLAIDSNGNVGINALTPVATLDVRGNTATTPTASISANSNFAALIADNRGNGDIFAASSSGLSRFVITQNGSVGIGTTSPNRLFELSASTSPYFRLNNTSTTLTTGNLLGTMEWQTNDPSTNATGVAASIQAIAESDFTANQGQVGLQFFTKDGITLTERMRIGNKGNVGIGTTAPVGLLHVNGIAGGNAAMIVNQAGSVGDIFTASSSGTNRFVITNAGNVGIGTALPAAFKLEIAGNIGPEASGTRDLGSAARVWNNLYVNNIIGGGSGTQGFWNLNNGALYPTQTTADFFIGGVATNSGTAAPNFAKFAVLNVNSGTPTASVSAGTAGGAYLTADGKLATTAKQTLTIGDSTTTGHVIINPSGNIGIGTTTPAQKLALAGNLSFDDADRTITTNGNYSLTINPAVNLNLGTTNVDLINIGRADGNIAIVFNSNSAEFGRITGGTLGIGTTSPLATLDVRGNTATTPTASISAVSNFAAMVVDNRGNGDIFTASSGAISRFVIKQNGSVGIGTTTPLSKLNVAGKIWAQADGDIGNTSRGIEITPAVFSSNNVIQAWNNTPDVGLVLQTKDTNGSAISSKILLESASAYISFSTSSSPSTTEAIERVRIDRNGNVGIGTTAPVGLLHVNGIAAGNSAAIINQAGSVGAVFTASAAGTTRFTIANDGSIVQTATTVAGTANVINANSITSGVAASISATALTTGTALGITASNPSSALTGNLINVASANHTYMTLNNRDLTIGGHTTSVSPGAVVQRVYVYDTAGDIDGGRWTDDERARSSSWYNEASGATRSSVKPFPRRAVLVATSTTLNIYDAKDNSLWMQFSKGSAEQMIGISSSTGASAFGLNGKIYFANSGSTGGLYVIDFKGDRSYKYSGADDYIGNKNIANRNATIAFTPGPSGPIANSSVNDVHGAVIKGKTYIVVVGSAVSPKSGVSIINETDNTVVTAAALTGEGAGTSYNKVFVLPNGNLYVWRGARLRVWYDLTSLTNGFTSTDAQYNASPATTVTYPNQTAKELYVTQGTSTVDGKSNTIYLAGTTPLTNASASAAVIQEKQGDSTNSSVKYYTLDNISEEQPGDIRGMWPIATASASTYNAGQTMPVGGRIRDVSVKAKDIIVKGGTVTLASGVRGTGVTLDGTNFLCNDSSGNCTNNDTNFNATTALTVSAWVNFSTTPANTATYSAIAKDNIGSARAYALGITNIGGNVLPTFFVNNNALISVASGSANLAPNTWYHLVGTYDGANINLYLNGNLAGTKAATGNVTTAVTAFTVGAYSDPVNTGKFIGTIDEPMVTLRAITSGQAQNMYAVGYRALQNHTANTIKGVTIGADNHQAIYETSITTGYNTIDVDMQKGLMYVGTDTKGFSVIGIDSDTLLDIYNSTTGQTDDAGIAFPSALDVSSHLSVGKGYGTGNLVALAGASSLWLESSNTDFKEFLASSYNPFGNSLTQSTLNVDTVFRVVNQLSSRIDNFGINSASSSGEMLAEAFRVDSNGTLFARSLMNSTTAMQFQDASSNVLFNIDSTNSRVGVGTASALFAFDVQAAAAATAAAQIYNTNNSANSTGLLVKLGFTGTGTAVTSPTAGNSFVRFMNGNGVSQGGIDSNGASGVVYSTGGIDFAEYFKKDDAEETFTAGDLMCIGNNGGATKCTTETTRRILGVVSDRPGFVGGSNRAGDPAYVLVGMVGQLPIKIAPDSEPIHKGDNLTFSTTPGFATKATKAGAIVGRALEEIDGNGMIMSSIQPTWYDPDAFLASTGDFMIDRDEVVGVDATATVTPYVIHNAFGGITDRVGAFAELAVANVRAGSINAQEIATNSLTINGQSLRDYIASVITDSGFTIQDSRIVSPIASIDRIRTNTISPLSSDSIVVNGKLVLRGSHPALDAGSIDSRLRGNDTVLEIQNASGSAVASIDTLGNATFSGQLTASSLVASSVQLEGATISGTLRADNIIANNIEGLDARIASIAAKEVSSSMYTVASGQQASSSGTLATNYELQTTNAIDIASYSGQLASVENLTASFGTFTQGLMSFGASSFDDVSVTGLLSIGSQFTISDTSINVLGSDLEFQPLRQGGVSFLSGLVRIDTDGNLSVNGDATFAKDVTVKGTLTTNIISPLPDSDLVIKLPVIASNSEAISGIATSTASPRNDIGRFAIQNAKGSNVVTVDQLGNIAASGSAKFTDILAKTFQIVRGAQADTSITQTVATASAGTATIITGETTRTIISPFVTEKSLIYITPTSDTQGMTPYVARQTAEDKENDMRGSFTIQIPQYVYEDITINWWIIN